MIQEAREDEERHSVTSSSISGIAEFWTFLQHPFEFADITGFYEIKALPFCPTRLDVSHLGKLKSMFAPLYFKSIERPVLAATNGVRGIGELKIILDFIHAFRNKIREMLFDFYSYQEHGKQLSGWVTD